LPKLHCCSHIVRVIKAEQLLAMMIMMMMLLRRRKRVVIVLMLAEALGSPDGEAGLEIRGTSLRGRGRRERKKEEEHLGQKMGTVVEEL
jgi:hypothetical protein